jgi:heme/copper-type cytochrome/quinol oxidase subunit 2
MSKKQIIITLVLIVIIAAAVIFGSFQQNNSQKNNASKTSGNQELPFEEKGYRADIPKDVTLTPPKIEAPASSNPNLQTKIRFFDLKATKDGFEPKSFVVNKGDTVQFDFTAVDGDYDLDFPYLGAYFSVVKKGETRRLPFDTSLPGTFLFECRDFCPKDKKIQGELIVLP